MGRNRTDPELNALRGNPGKRVQPAGKWEAVDAIKAMPSKPRGFTSAEDTAWEALISEYRPIITPADKEGLKMLATKMAMAETYKKANDVVSAQAMVDPNIVRTYLALDRAIMQQRQPFGKRMKKYLKGVSDQPASKKEQPAAPVKMLPKYLKFVTQG